MRCILIREVPLPLDTILKKLPRELRRHGFKLLGTINVGKEIHDSLGIDYKRCTLLTISNLQLTYKNLLRDEQSVLLHFLPLVLYDKDGGTAFTTFRPTQLFPMLQSDCREDEADTIERKLIEVLDIFCKKSSTKEKQIPGNLLKAVA